MASSVNDSIEGKRAFYDEYWTSRSTRRNLHELIRLGEIFNALAHVVTLDRRASFEICDLGCGTGWLSNELTAIGQVTGVDLSPVGIEHARKNYPNVEFEVGDVTAWEPQRQFDLVVSSEVLEHLSEKNRFLNTIKRITKSDGWVLITTPNKKVKGAWDAADMGEQILEDWVTPKQLQALFSDFEIIQHSTFLYDFAYVGVYRWLSAKKLRSFLRCCKVDPLYDALRQIIGLGLYQILLCRRR